MGKIRDWLFMEGDFSPRAEADAQASPAVDRENPEIVKVGDGLIPANITAMGYGALMSVDYASCEQTKARSLASLPVSVIRKGPNREKVDHPIAKLLNGMANEDMTGVDLLSWHRLRCDTFGNAYWRIEWYKGTIVAIWPMNGNVSHRFEKGNRPGYRTVYDYGGDDYTKPGRYYSDEIVRIGTYITKDGVRGVSLAKIAAEQIGLSVDLERFYAAMLHNGNHHLGHVEVPERNIPPAAMDDLRTAIEAKSGVDKAGIAPIFTAGAKWVNDGQSMQDASLIDQQRWILHQVCRATNVPPWKVYSQEDTAYSGSQQANIDYVTDTIVPDVRAIEKAFKPIFLARGEDDLQLKLDVRGLMRGDDEARSQYYREMVYAGTYTRADVRELEDMPPIDGLEKPLFPLNYGAIEKDGGVSVYSSDTAEPADGSQAGATD